MDVVIGAAICAAAVVGLFSAAAVRSRRARVAALQVVARRRGARMTRRAGLLLELSSPDLAIEVSFRPKRYKEGTRWVATVPPPPTATYDVVPSAEPRLYSFGDLLTVTGKQLSIGSAAFQEGFIVCGLDEELVARAWTSRACAILAEGFPRALLRSSGREISLELPEWVVDPHLLSTGIDLLVELATADVYGIGLLESLPDARPYRRGEADLPAVVVGGPGQVQIGLERVDGRVVTRARGEPAAPFGTGSVDVGRGTMPARTRLPPALTDATSLLGRLGDVQIAWRANEITVTWHAIETDRRRLVAAIDLLRLAGRPQTAAPFR